LAEALTVPDPLSLSTGWVQLTPDGSDVFNVSEASKPATIVQSAKLDHLIARLRELGIADSSGPASAAGTTAAEDEIPAKCLIFSQFPAFIEAICAMLEKNGVAFNRFDSKVSKEKRASAIEPFRQNTRVHRERYRDHPRVLVMSTKLSACGLTLIGCNYAFLMDPMLAVGVEEQAIGMSLCYFISFFSLLR
jgi:SNF2 family DNA or RNA helicase